MERYFLTESAELRLHLSHLECEADSTGFLQRVQFIGAVLVSIHVHNRYIYNPRNTLGSIPLFPSH